MGNYEEEENPAFRSIENGYSRIYNTSSFNNNKTIKSLNSIEDNNKLFTIVNGQNSYKISRKRFTKRLKIDKSNNSKDNIPMQGSNTNSNTNNTSSKSNGADMSENYLMLNANLDKFSRIRV